MHRINSFGEKLSGVQKMACVLVLALQSLFIMHPAMAKVQIQVRGYETCSGSEGFETAIGDGSLVVSVVDELQSESQASQQQGMSAHFCRFRIERDLAQNIGYSDLGELQHFLLNAHASALDEVVLIARVPQISNIRKAVAEQLRIVTYTVSSPAKSTLLQLFTDENISPNGDGDQKNEDKN